MNGRLITWCRLDLNNRLGYQFGQDFQAGGNLLFVAALSCDDGGESFQVRLDDCDDVATAIQQVGQEGNICRVDIGLGSWLGRVFDGRLDDARRWQETDSYRCADRQCQTGRWVEIMWLISGHGQYGRLNDWFEHIRRRRQEWQFRIVQGSQRWCDKRQRNSTSTSVDGQSRECLELFPNDRRRTECRHDAGFRVWTKAERNGWTGFIGL